MDIKGKNVIITGGAKGIGKALVAALVREGANVGAFDVDTAALDSLQKEFAGVFCLPCDVSMSQKAAEGVEAFCAKFKTVDILVNNAAVIYSAPLVSLAPGKIQTHDIAMWDKVIATNLSSVFYVTVAVAGKMVMNRTKGVIVNMGSIGAAGNPGQSPYSASKAAVSALTAVWAKELGLLGIRAVCIAPGFTKTDTTLGAMKDTVLQEWIRKTPLRRLGEVGEIVDAILFAIKNDLMNGKTLAIDGGLTL